MAQGLSAGAGGASNWGSLINTGASALGKFGNYASQGNKDKQTLKAYQAYQGYLHGLANRMQQELEARAEKYDRKLQNQFNEAEPQYQQEAYTQLPELTQLVQDIADQSAEAQRQNRRQVFANLAAQGVRGGQAGILANRATGELNRDLQRDINQQVYNEAANRQNSRLNYYSQKALTPWSAMSSAYGNSMVGANNALSSAQGNTYQNAYNMAMLNYMNTQNANKSSGFMGKLGNIGSGAASGAAAGSAFGPWGAAIGAVGGGVLGALKK